LLSEFWPRILSSLIALHFIHPSLSTFQPPNTFFIHQLQQPGFLAPAAINDPGSRTLKFRSLPSILLDLDVERDTNHLIHLPASEQFTLSITNTETFQ
jgi:hypothetical protein